MALKHDSMTNPDRGFHAVADGKRYVVFSPWYRYGRELRRHALCVAENHVEAHAIVSALRDAANERG